jgi:ankyrin repeat protein
MGCMSPYMLSDYAISINIWFRFLLAQLYLDSLIDKTSIKALKTALKRLPRGLEVLDDAYKEAMERIENQITDFRAVAKQVLSWVTWAKRPLTSRELRHALAVEVGTHELDEENLPEIGDVVSVCAGLVIVDKESDIIRLAHYTAQDYFERTQMSSFPNAQRDIAATCVTYLSFDVFAAGFCPTDEEFEARLRLYPLYDYAARNWGDHARAALTEVEKPILGLLESEAKVSAANQAMLASRSYSGYSQRVPRQTTGVHLAAYFGLTGVIMALLKNIHDSDVKDTYDRTPLSRAAEKGYEAVVRLLLEKGADVELRDVEYDRPPLSWAAEKGQREVVELLLQQTGVVADSKDSSDRTPLSWAAEKGQREVVELLLQQTGVVADSKDRNGRTPLLWAAEWGQERVVQLLLRRKDVIADSIDNNGQTSLSRAAERGRLKIVDLLLRQSDVAAESRDSNGRTPLSWAAEKGQREVVELLLRKPGVVADCKDNNDRTPLSWAAEKGQWEVVGILLRRHDVLTDSTDRNGRTPLSWAAETGQEQTMKLLLDNKADVAATIQGGWTALHYAAKNGHVAVVQMLLDRVDVDATSSDGTTALLAALEAGKEEVVNMLLSWDNVTLRNLVQKGNQRLTKKLLGAGYHVDTPDSWNRTPLHHAILSKYLEVVKELLSSGAAINFEDGDGMTPLRLALQRKECDFVRLLLEKSAHTKGITTNEWFSAFGKKPRQIMVLSEELGEKKSVNLIGENELKGELQKRPNETAKRLLCVLSFLYFKTSTD